MSTETSPEDKGKKLFVTKKISKEKKKKEDVLTTVVEVLKDISQQDTTADLQISRQETNGPESMKCDFFNCLCLVLGIKHLCIVSQLKVKEFRHIIFLGQVIYNISSPWIQ